ncbi:MAG TPA: PorP/SprF family type IX secretion system membrane protein [Ferruginibacter sp.]|nr:PorP/SprF family type IX secretion system membrane protein [Ferruginibacter sp.]HRE64230.1 PorP/SprF family type IX secretion system membrane protein [Ferruginibacter sp.]
MKQILKSLFTIAASIAMLPSQAQVDPHFTQYYVYPSWTNPALTGAFDGQYRLSAIYRTQWGNISSPYSTQGFSGEVTTASNMNYGIGIINQTAGDGGYRYTTAYGNLAFTGVRFGPAENHRIVLALQAGVIQRRFDPNKLTWGDQWNPINGYNPSNPTAEILQNNNKAVFDAGAGFLYFDGTPGKKANFYAGYAASHLTKPTDDFTEKENAKLPMRHTFHAGVKLSLSDNFSLTPNILYLKQGSAEEKMIGAYGQVKAAPETDFLIGANYRFKDAVSPFVGFTHKRLMLAASYDINTSDLGKMVKGSNSFEISLSFIGKRSLKAPAIDFVCPRL